VGRARTSTRAHERAQAHARACLDVRKVGLDSCVLRNVPVEMVGASILFMCPFLKRFACRSLGFGCRLFSPTCELGFQVGLLTALRALLVHALAERHARTDWSHMCVSRLACLGCSLRTRTRTRTRARAHARTRTRARAHSRTRAHAHTDTSLVGVQRLD
jgi:hypothetical protein